MTAKNNSKLADRVYQVVRGGILSGRYGLGSPLSRRRLAEELGMSLIPVAEALQRLEKEGLVESQPRVGTRVRIPTPQEIRGRYLVREALESQAARTFAAQATEEQKRQLRRLARRLDALSVACAKPGAGRKASLAFERLHLRYHMRIAECSKSRELIEAIEQSRVLVFNWLFNMTTDVEVLPDRWHQELTEVLCTGDVEAADKAMRRHVNYRREEIIERIRILSGRRRPPIVRGPQRRTLAKVRARQARPVEPAARLPETRSQGRLRLAAPRVEY